MDIDYSWMGEYNDAPPGWRQIDEKYLAQSTRFGRESPMKTESRQIMQNNKLIPVTLYVYSDGTGVGIEIDYWGHNADGVGYFYLPRPVNKKELLHVRWYTFERCKHNMEHTRNLGNCYNEYTCSKCGYIERIDSGD